MRSLDYAQGYYSGLIEASWTCYDCGNTYESAIENCPNKDLDQAAANLRAARSRSGSTAELLIETTPLENTDQRMWSVHAPDLCAGEHCTIHNRSDHHMRGWPQNWRSDRGLMERICPHGVGHPDPDEISTDTTHGCDGCCVPTEEREQHHDQDTIARWAQTLDEAYRWGTLVRVEMLDRTVEGQVDLPHGADHLYTVAGVSINAQYPSPKIVDIRSPRIEITKLPTEPHIGSTVRCCKDGDFYYHTAKGWMNEYGDGPFTWDQVACGDTFDPQVLLQGPL